MTALERPFLTLARSFWNQIERALNDLRKRVVDQYLIREMRAGEGVDTHGELISKCKPLLFARILVLGKMKEELIELRVCDLFPLDVWV